MPCSVQPQFWNANSKTVLGLSSFRCKHCPETDQQDDTSKDPARSSSHPSRSRASFYKKNSELSSGLPGNDHQCEMGLFSSEARRMKANGHELTGLGGVLPRTVPSIYSPTGGVYVLAQGPGFAPKVSREWKLLGRCPSGCGIPLRETLSRQGASLLSQGSWGCSTAWGDQSTASGNSFQSDASLILASR